MSQEQNLGNLYDTNASADIYGSGGNEVSDVAGQEGYQAVEQDGDEPFIDAGEAKAKGKGRSKKKFILIGAGIVVVAGAMAVLLAPQPEPFKQAQSKLPESETLAQQAAAPLAPPSGGAPAAGPVGIMGGGEPAPAAPAGVMGSAISAPAGMDAAAQATQLAQAHAAQSQAAPAPAPAQAPTVPAAPAAVAQAPQMHAPEPTPAAPAIAASVSPAQPPIASVPAAPELVAKVAAMERQIARLESKLAVQEASAGQSASVAPRKVAPVRKQVRITKKPAAKDVAEAKEKPAMEKRQLTYAPLSGAYAGTAAAATKSSDEVRVLGATNRPGGAVAVVEYGGVKHRASVGEAVPGLGRVSNVSIVAGRPMVEINGVLYK